jgi:hypothetical protein
MTEPERVTREQVEEAARIEEKFGDHECAALLRRLLTERDELQEEKDAALVVIKQLGDEREMDAMRFATARRAFAREALAQFPEWYRVVDLERYRDWLRAAAEGRE